MGFIYKWICVINGKSYIGKTTRTIEERLREHARDRKGNSAIHNAVKKHGWDNFTYEVLHECNNACLDTWEQIEILRHKTLSPNGYNLTTGGDGCSPTKITRDKLSKANKGRVPWNKGKKGIYSKETLAKLSKAMSGRNHPMLGRKRPDNIARNKARAKKKIIDFFLDRLFAIMV